MYADPILRKVFTILMENNVRNGDKIAQIKFYCQENSLSLTIFDEEDGVGIPIDEKKLIYHQRYGKNTGVQLFIVREILTITGLSIRETGEPRKGTRFDIMIPSGNIRCNRAVSILLIIDH